MRYLRFIKKGLLCSILGLFVIVCFVTTSLNADTKNLQVFSTDLPKDYEWYKVSDKKEASALLRGNLVKLHQIVSEKQGLVTISIANYSSGSSVLAVSFNSISQSEIKITFNKEDVAKLLKGEDPRNQYYGDIIKFLVLDDILYLGLLRSYF